MFCFLGFGAGEMPMRGYEAAASVYLFFFFLSVSV